MPFQEDASHRKSGEAAQAKSRTRLAEKCQVLVPEARALGRGPYRQRVRHGARGGHEKTRWEREGHVEITVLEIKLARTDVGQRIPAVHVVVHDHSRVPLADLIQTGADPAHSTAPV